ncbi:hypothetical protein SAMN04490183_2191 [Pseudomonas corrugata]|nr:hypothetical protein SAMN04490183_2191 [Pseudomonas corrugata]
MTDTPPSRASPLPHGIWGGRSFCIHHPPLWEPGLPAMAAAQSTSQWRTLRHREQARSHMGFEGGRCFCIHLRPLWEPGLPAMAAAQSTSPWQTLRHREQARSHMGFESGRSFCIHLRPLWEPGLPAMAAAQSTSPWQTLRHREQARSHMGFEVDAAFAYTSGPCGSRACPRWRRHSQHLRGGHSAFASRPAPTWDSRVIREGVRRCGSATRPSEPGRRTIWRAFSSSHGRDEFSR